MFERSLTRTRTALRVLLCMQYTPIYALPKIIVSFKINALFGDFSYLERRNRRRWLTRPLVIDALTAGMLDAKSPPGDAPPDPHLTGKATGNEHVGFV